MHPKLRQFLEANGLRADATEAEAWEYYKQVQAGGFSYVGPERAESIPEIPAGRSDAEPPGASVPSLPAQPVLDQEAIARAIAADRQRTAEIEDICRHVGMDEQTIRQMITSGVSVDAARKAALEHLRAGNVPFGVGAGQHLIVGAESRDKLRDAITDGLLLRSGHRIDKPASGSREFRGRHLTEVVRELMVSSGINVRGLSNRELVSRALGSASQSDLPAVFASLVNKSLLKGYDEWPQTWRPIVAVTSANDFRDMYAIRLSGAPDLKGLNENGEYQTAEFSDAKESYRLVRKGIKVPFTFEMIINDDLRALDRTPRLFGAAAKRMEGDAVYSLLTTNGAMSDGKAVFHADHKNLSAAAALAVDSIDAGRSTMRKQVGMAGENIDASPAFLLTPVALETKADVLLRSASYPVPEYSSGVVSPSWLGKLTAISDPHLDAASTTAWYLLCHPNMIPFIEASWLEGDEQPFVDEMMDFHSDGIIYKVRHCFGAGVVDWVGAHKNPGL